MAGVDSVAREALRLDELRSTLLPPLARVEVVDRSGSTNADLAAAAQADPTAWPDRSLLVTEHQYAGRGRLGRTWTTPARSALTMSLLLRPSVTTEATWGWYSLLVGLAVTRVLRTDGVAAGLKWPNDVLIGGRKVAGILGEIIHPTAVVIGLGLNVGLTTEELPVETATSLAIEAVDGTVLDRTPLLIDLITEISRLDDDLRAAGGDAEASGLAPQVREVCLTLSQRVRVELPGQPDLFGVAATIDSSGALVLDSGRAVRAGDVHHVR